MTDYDSIHDDERRERRGQEQGHWKARGRSFLRWLSDRPAESWLFFVGGLLAGKILL